jgi:acetylornithine deacetylase/succinyl-diaminopimelate desuccinylase-like protein
VTYTAVSDEETGGEWGARYLVENHPEYHGDAVISGEPSANNVIRFGERGTCWTEVRVTGEGAAASYVGGINAIEVLCDYLDEVRRLPDLDHLVHIPEDVERVIRESREGFDASWGEGATERVLHVTSSVGVIDGGRVGAVNVTPESASARVDIRLPVGTTGEEVLAELRERAADYPGTIELERYEGTDATYSDRTHPIFRALQESAARVRGGDEPVFGVSLAGTDCRYWRQAGVPCAVYGPTPHNVGNQNEYVHLEEFEEVLKAQAAAAAQFVRGE